MPEQRDSKPVTSDDIGAIHAHLDRVQETTSLSLGRLQEAHAAELRELRRVLEGVTVWQQGHEKKHAKDDERLFGNDYGVTSRVAKLEKEVTTLDRLRWKVAGIVSAVWAVVVVVWELLTNHGKGGIGSP